MPTAKNSSARVSIRLISITTTLCAAFASAQDWHPAGAVSNGWARIACSADGKRVAATSVSGIFISSDSGTNWVQANPALPNAYSVAVSADGTKMVAAGARAIAGPIYVSADSGSNWVQTSAPITNWYSVSSSADGSHLAAVGYGPSGFCFTSTNSGASWYPSTTLPSRSWFDVASSADGTRIAVAALNGAHPYCCTSADRGATWNATPLVSGGLVSIASSVDGKRIVAAASAGWAKIVVSQDSGETWITNNVPQYSWQSVACSADGAKMVVCCGGISNYWAFPVGLVSVPIQGPIYRSADFGQTWTSNHVQNLQWNCVASSADGSVLYAVENTGGQIYTAKSVSAPMLKVAHLNGDLALSWTLPSADFILQQSWNLLDWSDVTTEPILNLSTLENQLTLPKSGDRAFYRLSLH